MVVVIFVLLNQNAFAQQTLPQPAQPPQYSQAAQSRNSGLAQTDCAPSYPQKPIVAGTRAVIFASTTGAEGAQVYLSGICQGLMRREAPNRNAYALIVSNVPLGSYAVIVRMQGYPDFQTTVNVTASSLPPGKTPYVMVRFELSSFAQDDVTVTSCPQSNLPVKFEVDCSHVADPATKQFCKSFAENQACKVFPVYRRITGIHLEESCSEFKYVIYDTNNVERFYRKLERSRTSDMADRQARFNRMYDEVSDGTAKRYLVSHGCAAF